MKKFISISLILIGAALIATIVVWYLLQGILAENSGVKGEGLTNTFIEENMGESRPEDASDTETVSNGASSTLNLTEEQREAAESIGIDPDGINITDEMIDCASEKLSEKRIEEILAGAAPTILETLSLIPCLKS